MKSARLICSGLFLAAAAMLTGAANTNNATSLTLSSTAFKPGGDIPAIHTCDGGDVSPPLNWSGVPAAAKSLALIVDDPDASPSTFVHWVLYNIPPNATGLAQGVKSRDLPSGTREGLNDFERAGYGGPCPPSGRHRYVHKLYALDTALPDLGKANKAKLEKAMQGHVIGQAELIGVYQRKK